MAEVGPVVQVMSELPGVNLQSDSAGEVLQGCIQELQASGQQPNIIINCQGNVIVSDGESTDDDDDDTHEKICKPEQLSECARFRKFLNYIDPFRYFVRDRTLGFKKKLKFFYEKVTVARVTWLDEERLKPIKEYYATLELICDKVPTTIDKIFTDKKGEVVTRILVEGQPGYGKTTLTNKLAYDWAVGEEYLLRFNLCLLQPLRSLKHRHIDDGIRAIGKCCGFENTTDAVEIVKQNAASTLLILDGLDELSDSARSAILEVLFKREFYRDMTVIATSRTGLFSLQPNEVEELHGGVSMVSSFYEKRLTILGIPEEERKTFVSKFMPEENAQLVMNQLEKLTEPVVELFKSPLFLALLAIMIENDAIISELKTKTFLYMNLSNFVIRRSSERELMNPKNAGKVLEALTDDFNLFDFKQIPEVTKTCQRTFYEFGRRSLRQILTNDVQFKCDAVTRRVYEYGFLINHTVIHPFNTRKHYEPFHFSIMEFAAAYFLYRDYRISNFKFSAKLIGILKEILLEKGKTSLLLQFLVGLMGERAPDLFTHLLPLANIISEQETPFLEMIKECQPSMRLPKTLEPFIPIHRYSSDYCHAFMSATSFSADVVKFGIETKKITSMCIDSNSLWKIPLDVVVPILNFTVWFHADDLLKEDTYAYLCRIKCERLNFHLQNFVNVERHFKLFDSISADYKTLTFAHQSQYSVCVDYLKSGNELSSKFDLKVRYPSIFPGCEEFLQILLQRNLIKKLQLNTFGSPSDKFFDFLFSECAKSDYLDSLIVHNNSNEVLKIDVNKLTLNGQKQWKSLVLHNVTLKHENDFIEKIKPISFMAINGLDFDLGITKIINVMTFQTFQCKAELLIWILDNFLQSWSGYNSVNDLTVIMNNWSTCDDVISSNAMWNKLSKFRNLQVLQIFIAVSDNLIPQEEIVNSFQSLPITELKLFATASGMKFVSNFCNGQRGLSCFENLPKNLRIIEFVCVYMHVELKSNRLDEVCEIISELTECVKKKKIEKVNIAYFNTELLPLIFRRKIIDESVFKLELNVREIISPIFDFADRNDASVLSVTLKDI